MYVISCAHCGRRLTEQAFATFDAAQEAANTLGSPTGETGEFWCEDCSRRLGSQNSHTRPTSRARSGSPSKPDQGP